MKILIAPLIFCALLCGQVAAPGQPPSPVQPPASVTPGAPSVNAPAAPAPPATATPPAPLPPDTVVAEVDGKKYTAAEIDKLIQMLPPQYQQAAKTQPQM